ncbi:hypothetical protein RFI_14491 [Reticulomyxa filosa]|uniref:Uncharacterized protein n=1 Tax=Reticulomyxa filosa TaxID=46433 RepID=X6NAA4_RETFI|nr:hypothetical protein RFI_14491 [Reticulomyxa filosa]|eukprot:ETO22699.1 hypothetical protein RFI_14491 [Reticulomyxa filosa]
MCFERRIKKLIIDEERTPTHNTPLPKIVSRSIIKENKIPHFKNKPLQNKRGQINQEKNSKFNQTPKKKKRISTQKFKRDRVEKKGKHCKNKKTSATKKVTCCNMPYSFKNKTTKKNRHSLHLIESSPFLFNKLFVFFFSKFAFARFFGSFCQSYFYKRRGTKKKKKKETKENKKKNKKNGDNAQNKNKNKKMASYSSPNRASKLSTKMEYSQANNFDNEP